MSTLIPYIPLLLQGAAITFVAWLITSITSITLGTLFGIASCRYLASPRLIALIRVYTFIAKGIPAYVQILIAYFVVPAALGVHISGLIAAIGALTFCSSGYATEIIRAGINNIPSGQWEACSVLGYSMHSTLIRIILPQTLAAIAPALLGEFEQLLKSTSLLAAIGITELTRTGMNIISRELNPLPVYLTVACIYLLFSAFIQLAIIITERKNRYGYR